MTKLELEAKLMSKAYRLLIDDIQLRNETKYDGLSTHEQAMKSQRGLLCLQFVFHCHSSTLIGISVKQLRR